ncbi:hypothetical protein O3299_21920 [Janthinobacterium sp. SUN176]|uniref:STY0301 family protein n=1 Tax=Janthinobacterium sp. SUN176 TaxID=3014788 RepID=UPI0027125F8A|nr:STY0301 family protein [Janthinobacterium sp. SUN176]MDO8074201.1 hypothetical protein [Janthinobacterium sp. SUN176]
MRHKRLSICAAGCIFPVFTQAAVTASYACPQSVPATSISLNAVPAGWTPYIGSSLYLSAAAPIDGAPERRGQLVPGGERTKKGRTILSYRLEGPYPDGKWLQCSYGAHGEVTLSRRMDDSVSLCEFTYRKGSKAGQNEIDIDCR